MLFLSCIMSREDLVSIWCRSHSLLVLLGSPLKMCCFSFLCFVLWKWVTECTHLLEVGVRVGKWEMELCTMSCGEAVRINLYEWFFVSLLWFIYLCRLFYQDGLMWFRLYFQCSAVYFTAQIVLVVGNCCILILYPFHMPLSFCLLSTSSFCGTVRYQDFFLC